MPSAIIKVRVVEADAVAVRRQDPGLVPAQPGVEKLQSAIAVLVIRLVKAQVKARQGDRAKSVQQRAQK